jgi:hypothetical protein
MLILRFSAVYHWNNLNFVAYPYLLYGLKIKGGLSLLYVVWSRISASDFKFVSNELIHSCYFFSTTNPRHRNFLHASIRTTLSGICCCRQYKNALEEYVFVCPAGYLQDGEVGKILLFLDCTLWTFPNKTFLPPFRNVLLWPKYTLQPMA